jgi:hypothetical protein
MAKRNRNELVSESFSKYISQAQARLLADTGKKFSRRDITAFLAMQQPVIKIEVKKRRNGTIFDF